MKIRLNYSAPAIIAGLCLLFVTGCMSNTASNVSDRGSPATQAELTAHFSGKFFALGSQGGSYYAPDGTYQSVGPAGEQISIGTWSADRALCVNAVFYGVQNGQTGSTAPQTDCFLIWINEDGTAVADPVGAGPNANIPRPQSGFPIQARFNALRRSMGV